MALDRFSAQAADYARYRIDYPLALYDWLLPQVVGRARAWDCATGNGQVAVVLAGYFAFVEATDLSANQLAQAAPHPNIRYQTARAEQTPFLNQAFDLITVAQAVHWFEPAAYHREVRRVALPGAVLAEWGYGLVQVLGPTLVPGDVVVLDNLPVHKVAGMAQLVEARGARLLFLPPYSPDFAPIEQDWSKRKTALRTAQARTREALEQALNQALAWITSQDAQNWFDHCGYHVLSL